MGKVAALFRWSKVSRRTRWSRYALLTSRKSQQPALRRLGSWCGQLHATEVTAGMTVTVVEGAQGGPKQVEHLSSDEAVKVFVEAGRPVTLTFRLP